MNNLNIKHLITEMINHRFYLILKGRSRYKSETFKASMRKLLYCMDKSDCDYMAILTFKKNTDILREAVKKEEHKIRLENFFKEVKLKPVKKIVELCLHFEN